MFVHHITANCNLSLLYSFFSSRQHGKIIFFVLPDIQKIPLNLFQVEVISLNIFLFFQYTQSSVLSISVISIYFMPFSSLTLMTVLEFDMQTWTWSKLKTNGKIPVCNSFFIKIYIYMFISAFSQKDESHLLFGHTVKIFLFQDENSSNDCTSIH